MKRLLIIVLLSILAAGCATPRSGMRVAKVEASQVSEELECMVECLDEPDGSCDECAMQCFQVAPTGTVAHVLPLIR